MYEEIYAANKTTTLSIRLQVNSVRSPSPASPYNALRLIITWVMTRT